MTTTLIILSLTAIGAFSILFWIGIFIRWLKKPTHKPVIGVDIKQYEITITGTYSRLFIVLLRNVCRTHKTFYGDNVELQEVVDPSVFKRIDFEQYEKPQTIVAAPYQGGNGVGTP